MRARMLSVSLFVVKISRMLMLEFRETSLDQTPFVSNGSIGGDKPLIHIGHDCITRGQMKKDSSASQERFNISSSVFGKSKTLVINEPSLTARPFDEWLQIYAILCVELSTIIIAGIF